MFTNKASLYSQYRPGYPEAYIKYLLSETGIKKSAVVADIGSGTGILSRQLLEQDLVVYGVEPNDDMRLRAEQSLRQYMKFTSVKGMAEDTNLKDSSIDLVTAAQAFHWFDQGKFKQECRRILKQNAQVALVWNSRNLTSPLMKETAAVCRYYCPDFTGFSGGIEERPEIYKAFFREGNYQYKTFQNDLIFDYDGFIGRNLSASFAPAKEDASYKDFIAALSGLFEKYSHEGKILIPNKIRSYIGMV